MPQGLRSQDVIDFAHAYLRVPEGRGVGQLLVLRPWQQDIIRRIYDQPTRLAIVSMGRKNGKTSLVAMLVLAHLVGPMARRNSQIFSAAQSRDQAALVFGLAAKMIRMSPELNDLITIRDARKELFCGLTGVTYRALSADADTGHGLSACLIIHDELGRVRGPHSALYEILESGMGAQDAPLSIIISTQAGADDDLLSQLLDDGLTGADPATVVVFYTAPPDLDPFAEATIRLANPAFGDFLNPVEVHAQALKASRMPILENNYRNLTLNQRVAQQGSFVSALTWDACAAAPKSLQGVPVYGALDLATVDDLAALNLVGQVEGIWQVHPVFWLPAQGLVEKARRDHAPYDLWARDGFITPTPGATIDFTFIAHYLRDAFQKYDIRRIAFDRWNFDRLKVQLLAVGFTQHELDQKFFMFGQGYRSMSPALNSLETELLNVRLAHGGHPVLKMCALNAVVEMDAAGNRKLTKSKSTGRIDGAVALAMAIDVATSTVEALDPGEELNAAIIARGGFA